MKPDLNQSQLTAGLHACLSLLAYLLGAPGVAALADEWHERDRELYSTLQSLGFFPPEPSPFVATAEPLSTQDAMPSAIDADLAKLRADAEAEAARIIAEAQARADAMAVPQVPDTDPVTKDTEETTPA